MPTPDASQYTQLKKYTAISETEITSTGKKQANKFNTFRVPSFLSAGSLFLPSANKDSKIALTAPPPPLPDGYAGALQFTSSATPSYLRVDPKASLFPGTQPFTISFYLYLSSTGGLYPRPFALSRGTVGSGTQILAVSIEANYFYLWVDNIYILRFSYAGNKDSWHFINIYGTGATGIKVEVDGVLKGTSNAAYNIANPYNATCYLNIGSYPQDASQANVSLKGYLANFRWVVGSGLSVIPKPSPPLPVIPGKTSLLLLAKSKATAFRDSGTDDVNTSVVLVGPSPPTWSSQLVV
jgi:hypothetical protein